MVMASEETRLTSAIAAAIRMVRRYGGITPDLEGNKFFSNRWLNSAVDEERYPPYM